MTDTSNTYQGIVQWGNGQSAAAGVVTALGNGLYKVAGDVLDSAAGWFASQVTLLTPVGLQVVAAAQAPGKDEGQDAAGPTEKVAGPAVVPGGGQYTYAVWFTAIDAKKVDVSNAAWKITDSSGVALDKGNVVAKGFFLNPADRGQYIGYYVTVSFPNYATKYTFALDGLVYDGKRLTADPRTVIVVGLEVVKQEVMEQPEKLKATLSQAKYVVLNTRAGIYLRINMTSLKGYQTELKKGLIGYADKVNLVGVGTNKMEGVSHIQLGWVRNIQKDFRVDYLSDRWINGGTGTFKPMSNGQSVKGWMLDETRNPTDPAGPNPNGLGIGVGGGTAFANSPSEITVGLILTFATIFILG